MEQHGVCFPAWPVLNGPGSQGRKCEGLKSPSEEQKEAEEMSEKQFEDFMRDSIIKAYKSVMGAEKWESLTNAEKDQVLHIMLNDFARRVL